MREKFRKIPVGNGQPSQPSDIFDPQLDTSYGLDQLMEVRQAENKDTCVIVNVLNALIGLVDAVTYH